MKFDCGETLEEQKLRRGKWHRWYAWRPVKLADHDCRWLEVVERRSKCVCVYADAYWVHEYRAIKKT